MRKYFEPPRRPSTREQHRNNVVMSDRKYIITFLAFVILETKVVILPLASAYPRLHLPI